MTFLKTKVLRFLVLTVIGVAVGAVWAMLHGSAATVVSATTSEPVATAAGVAGVHIGGPFSLIDQTGRAVTEKSWPGKFKLVFFGFTHCPDVCPVTLQKLSAVLEALGPQAQRVQMLFITVDPERDTPKVLGAYVSNFSKAIIGLTGTEKQVKAAEDTYRVYAAKEPIEGGKDYVVDHSAYIYLMSPDDHAVEIIDDQLTAEEIAAKIRQHI